MKILHGMHLPLLLAVLALTWLAGLSPACAQGYPSRTVRLIVPFAPAGGTDIADAKIRVE